MYVIKLENTQWDLPRGNLYGEQPRETEENNKLNCTSCYSKHVKLTFNVCGNL